MALDVECDWLEDVRSYSNFLAMFSSEPLPIVMSFLRFAILFEKRFPEPLASTNKQREKRSE